MKDSGFEFSEDITNVPTGCSDTDNDDELPPLDPEDFECIGCSGVFPKSTLAPSNLRGCIYRCRACSRARNKEWRQSDLRVNKLAHNIRRLKGLEGTGLGAVAVRKLLEMFGMRTGPLPRQHHKASLG